MTESMSFLTPSSLYHFVYFCSCHVARRKSYRLINQPFEIHEEATNMLKATEAQNTVIGEKLAGKSAEWGEGRKATRKARFFLWALLAHLRISVGITGDHPVPHLCSLLQRPKQGRETFLAPYSLLKCPFRFEQGIELFGRNLTTKLFLLSFLHFQALCLFLWRENFLEQWHFVTLFDFFCKDNGNHLPLAPGKFRFHSVSLALWSAILHPDVKNGYKHNCSWLQAYAVVAKW